MNPIHVGEVHDLRSYGDLVIEWTSRIIRARYQQSLIGVAWAVVQPAATVAIFSVVFTRFVQVDTNGPPYILFSFAAMVPWTFFSTALTDMTGSLVENMNLVAKIYFPRELLPLAAMLARSLDFLIAGAFLVAMMVYFKTAPFLLGWLYLPAIVAVQLMLTMGLGLCSAALNVFYRDIKHLVELVLRLLLYGSPIIYAPSAVPEQYRSIYYLNPMAGIVTAYRDVLLYQSLPGSYLTTSAVLSLVALVAGYLFFKRVEPQFADVV